MFFYDIIHYSIFSLVRQTQEACASHLEEWAEILLVINEPFIVLLLNLCKYLTLAVFPVDCLSRLGHKPLFISAIGKDSHSDAVLNYCKHMVSFLLFSRFYYPVATLIL